MEQQEYLMKLSMIEQEASQLQERIEMMDQQVQDLQAIKVSLEDLGKGKESTEILANLGKGIFIKAETKSKELLVNVGKNIVVKKTPQETMKILEEQIEKLIAGRRDAINRIEQLQQEMQVLVEHAEKERAKQEKSKIQKK